MKLDRNTLTTLITLFYIGLFSNIVVSQNFENVVEEDLFFTSLFAQDSAGVTGADGMYSVLLPNGQTLWIFGDTFLGKVNADGSRNKIDPVFVRNAVAIQEGNKLITYFGKTAERDASFLIPPGAPVGKVFSEDSLWFWPGDAYVENGRVKLFLSSFYQAGEGGWGFKWTGTWIATLNLPDLKLEDLSRIDIPLNPEIHWGHAVFDEDPVFLYVYGLGSSKPFAARIPKAKNGKTKVSDYSQWQFLSGSDWVTSAGEAKPMLDFKGAEQFSVFKLDDKFVYLSQEGGFSNKIYTFVAETPFGEWQDSTCIYSVPEFENEHLFAYNALAHPQFVKYGKLLVSFCVNSFEMADVFKNADNYRPRFIRVPVKTILKEQQ